MVRQPRQWLLVWTGCWQVLPLAASCSSPTGFLERCLLSPDGQWVDTPIQGQIRTHLGEFEFGSNPEIDWYGWRPCSSVWAARQAWHYCVLWRWKRLRAVCPRAEGCWEVTGTIEDCVWPGEWPLWTVSTGGEGLFVCRRIPSPWDRAWHTVGPHQRLSLTWR